MPAQDTAIGDERERDTERECAPSQSARNGFHPTHLDCHWTLSAALRFLTAWHAGYKTTRRWSLVLSV